MAEWLIAWALMARIFTCGFEENDLLNTMWSGTFNTAPTIQTTTVHSGTYALTKVTGTQGEVFRQLGTALTSGNIYSRFYFRMAGLPTFTRTMHVVTNTSAVDTYRLRVTATTGVMTLVNAVTSTTINGPTLTTGVWYRIEVRHLISDTVGQIEVRVWSLSGTTETEMSGSPFGDGNFTGGDGTDADTLNTNVSRWTYGAVDGSWGADIFFDDIALQDDSGATFTTYPIGAGKIALIEPASNVSITWEDDDAVSAATFANINELPGAPVDTAYNLETVTLNSIDQFGVTGLPAEVPSDADMILVDLYARVGSDQPAAATARFKIWDETTTLTTGPNIDCGVNGWRIGTVSAAGGTNEHQVFSLGTRSKANVDAFNIGYENLTDLATRDRRVSTLWANVEWIEGGAAGASVAQTMPAMGELMASGGYIGRQLSRT